MYQGCVNCLCIVYICMYLAPLSTNPLAINLSRQSRPFISTIVPEVQYQPLSVLVVPPFIPLRNRKRRLDPGPGRLAILGGTTISPTPSVVLLNILLVIIHLCSREQRPPTTALPMPSKHTTPRTGRGQPVAPAIQGIQCENLPGQPVYKSSRGESGFRMRAQG